MKKVCIFILCLFSFLGIVFAKDDDGHKLYIKVNNKKVDSIVSKKGKTIDVDVYFEGKNFAANAIIMAVKFDNKKLELVDAKGHNNFEITSGINILADRIMIPEDDDNRVMTLKFKVLKSGSSKIELLNIQAANVEKQLDLEPVSFKISTLSKGFVIGCIAGVLVIGGAAVFVIKKKKN